MSAGRLLTTPWSRAAMKRLDIDWNAIAQRIPDNASIHVSERKPNGPWFVRGFVEHREVTDFDKSSPGSPDLGHALEYVLAMVRGEVASGRRT